MAYVPEDERKMISDLARENNCWIQHGRTWYTPDEFDQLNRNGSGIGKKHTKIRNPLSALYEGRSKIIAIATNEKSDWRALYDTLNRLFSFEDKIRNSGFKSIPNQPDEIKTH